MYFRGTRGILLRMDDGKEHLISSCHPERLAAIVEAAKSLT